MCVIFFYANSNPRPGGYKLILASNRDEFYHRDTRTVSRWPNTNPDGQQYVYGGIDLEPGREGGTWLAIGGHNGVYKIGALLNLTGEPKPQNAIAHNNNIHHHCFHAAHQVYFNQHNNHHHPDSHQAIHPDDETEQQLHEMAMCPALEHKLHDHYSLVGRGMIVSDFVTSLDDCTLETYNKSLVEDCRKYSAFNFVSIEIGSRSKPASIKLCSNVPPTLETFEEGKCYGFGNSLPSQPFEKVRYGQQRLEDIVAEFNAKQEKLASHEPNLELQDELVGNLKSLLKCNTKFWPDAELQRRAPNWGEYLSALNVNVEGQGYGSRTHTIILVDGNDRMHFIEETMATLDPAGEWQRTHVVEDYFKKASL